MAPTELKLNELDEYLDGLDYPIGRGEARERVGATRLRYADGSERLADVIGRCTSERFESASDLLDEVLSNLPTEAVGEPGQSEGDA